jgi:cell division protein FtsW (lipid II flippase)
MKRLITLARLLIFLLAAFFAVFSLEATLADTLINLIPTFILVAILLISFPSPRIATFLLLITTLLFTFFFTTYDYYLKFIIITLTLTIAFLIFLFYIILSEEKIGRHNEDYDYDEEDDDY